MIAASQPPEPRLYRFALLAFPRRMRNSYGDEMIATYSRALAQRQGLGRSARRRFAVRAWFDAVRAGIGARFHRGGGLPPSKRPGDSARDWLGREVVTDLRLALRALRKEPVFALTVIAVLALGVGINGALSNALRAVFLAPPPFNAPNRLVVLDLALAENGSAEPPRATIWSYPKYKILEETDDLAAGPIAAYTRRQVALTERGTAEQLTAEIITRDYFQVLEVPARRGVTVARKGEIVITAGLAQSLFGETDPVGEELVLNGQRLAVAGVAPAGFRGLTGGADLWLPMESVTEVISPTLLENFDGHWLLAIGRLRPGRSLEELRAQMPAIGARVHETFTWDDATTTQTGAARAFEEVRRNPDAQQAVAIVAVAAGLVLLIACANLALLLHSHIRRREREIGVRLALGSSRWRVARIFLVEVALLAVAAGIVGVAVASISTGVITQAWPSSFSTGSWNVRFVDTAGLGFGTMTSIITFALACLAGVVFALVPVYRATGADVPTALRSGGRTGTRGEGGGRWLLATEVAVALILTVGAGLMISSISRLSRVEQGFDSNNLLVANYTLARGSEEAASPAAFHDDFLRRVRALPGVTGAGLDCSAPLDGHCWITGVRRAGDQRWESGARPSIGVHLVDNAHFDMLGIPLRQGRLFESYEGPDSPAVAIITEAAAARLFPDGDALGQPLAMGVGLTSGEDTAEIIGVVGDVLYDSPASGLIPEAYILQRQEPSRGATVIIRTAGEPLDLVPQVRAVLAEVAPDVPLTAVRTVADIGAGQIGDSTAVANLLTTFAALAVLLAATGVWGTVTQAVGHRRRELGIRMALGAQPRQVVGMSVRDGLLWAVGGAAAGLAGAWFLSRSLASMLFEITPTDAMAYAASAILLIAVSTLASYLPARHAGLVDPASTLRAE